MISKNTREGLANEILVAFAESFVAGGRFVEYAKLEA
jgi:hypothetical protein